MREPSEAATIAAARALYIDRYGERFADIFDRHHARGFGDTAESQSMLDKSFRDARTALRAAYAVDAREATDAKPSQR